MQKVFILLVFLSLFSCSEDEPLVVPELVGTWRIIEVLADPGDGSGTFQPIAREKTVAFFESGEVISNGPLCGSLNQTSEIGQGVYSLQDSTITPFCANLDFSTKIYFEFEGANLILNYPCIERCAEKYLKE